MLLTQASVLALSWIASPSSPLRTRHSPRQSSAIHAAMSTVVQDASAVAVPPLRWSEEADETWYFDGSRFGASDSLTVNYIAAGPKDGQP